MLKSLITRAPWLTKSPAILSIRFFTVDPFAQELQKPVQLPSKYTIDKERYKIKVLKEKFKPLPKVTKSADGRLVFFSEFLKQHAGKKPLKEMQTAWQTLDVTEKSKYADMAQKKTKEQDAVLNAYIKDQSFYDVAVYQELAASCKKIGVKPPRFENFKVPKRVSTMAIYVKDRLKHVNPQMKLTERLSIVAKEWKDMSTEQRESFLKPYESEIQEKKQSWKEYSMELEKAQGTLKQELDIKIKEWKQGTGKKASSAKAKFLKKVEKLKKAQKEL